MEERLQTFALGQPTNIDQPAMSPPFFNVGFLRVGMELGSKREINTSQSRKLTSVELGLFVGNANYAIDVWKEEPFQPALPNARPEKRCGDWWSLDIGPDGDRPILGE